VNGWKWEGFRLCGGSHKRAPSKGNMRIGKLRVRIGNWQIDGSMLASGTDTNDIKIVEHMGSE
jgi:hypothetical protein